MESERTLKPWPAKGYVRADLAVERSTFEPSCLYIRKSRGETVHAYIREDGFVCFSGWLFAHTGPGMRIELINLLKRGYVGPVPGVWMLPSAFPRQYISTFAEEVA